MSLETALDFVKEHLGILNEFGYYHWLDVVLDRLKKEKEKENDVEIILKNGEHFFIEKKDIADVLFDSHIGIETKQEPAVYILKYNTILDIYKNKDVFLKAFEICRDLLEQIQKIRSDIKKTNGEEQKRLYDVLYRLEDQKRKIINERHGSSIQIVEGGSYYKKYMKYKMKYLNLKN